MVFAVFKYMFVFFVGYFFSLWIAPEKSGLLAWLSTIDPSYIFTGLSAIISICIASYTHYKAKEREAESRVFIEKSKVYSEFFDLIFDMMRGVKNKDDNILNDDVINRFFNLKKKMYMWGNKKVLQCISDLSDPDKQGSNVLGVAERLMSELRLDLGHKDKFSFIKYIVTQDDK